MSSEVAIQSGNIKWLNAANQNGIIALPQGPEMGDVYFDFKDVEIGTPRVGQMVQFVTEQGPLGPVARKIHVVSDVARGAVKRAK
jgi:cold shock CspA family protein